MSKNEIFEQISSLFEEFSINHNTTTKVGAQRARKAIGGIKKLVSTYRKASIDESK